MYFLANRIWWSLGLLVGPIAGAFAGSVIVAIAVVSVVALSALLVFDTERPWWPDEVARLPEDEDRTRAERRRLTVWTGAALLIGLVSAFALL